MTEYLDEIQALSAVLFAIGAFGFLARRNIILMLVSVEVMLLELAPVRPCLRGGAGGRLHLGLSPKARRAAA